MVAYFETEVVICGQLSAKTVGSLREGNTSGALLILGRISGGDSEEAASSDPQRGAKTNSASAFRCPPPESLYTPPVNDLLYNYNYFEDDISKSVFISAVILVE